MILDWVVLVLSVGAFGAAALVLWASSGGEE